METFVTAYIIVWLAVAGYVVRLGLRQRHLLRSLESLEKRFAARDESETPASRAA